MTVKRIDISYAFLADFLTHGMDNYHSRVTPMQDLTGLTIQQAYAGEAELQLYVDIPGMGGEEDELLNPAYRKEYCGCPEHEEHSA